ncbi:MAG: RidA family protein [Maribacter sp.]|nr:RidA family protein [Maribacter sp.]
MKNVLRFLPLLLLASCNTQLDRAPKEEKVAEKIQQVDDDYDPEAKLEALGISLSAPSSPVANYVHAVRSGNLIFLAGKGPRKGDGTYITGKLGADLTVEQGYEAARLTGINQLSVLKAELGNLNKVKRIVKVLGMVNAVPEFTDHPEVVNGFSDLMVEVFGEKGKHARAAVGMGSLPRNTAVEIEMIVEIEE